MIKFSTRQYMHKKYFLLIFAQYNLRKNIFTELFLDDCNVSSFFHPAKRVLLLYTQLRPVYD